MSEISCNYCGGEHYTESHFNWCGYHNLSHDPRFCDREDVERRVADKEEMEMEKAEISLQRRGLA